MNKTDVAATAEAALEATTSKAEAASKTEDDKEKELIDKAISIYRYVEIYEETKSLNKQKCLPSFTKQWNGIEDEQQWTSNHYFYQDKDEEAMGGNDKRCGVFLTSYQLEQMLVDVKKSNLERPMLEAFSGKQSSPSSPPDNLYFKLHKPKFLKCDMPEDVETILNSLKSNLKDCDTLEQVLNALIPRLNTLTQDQLIDRNLKSVLDYSKLYWNRKLNEAIVKAYKTCYDWFDGSIDRDQYELVLGLGHVRKLDVVNKKKTEQEERKRIVNSPLIEILVDAVYENSTITVFPVHKARVKWSIEAKSVLVTGGEGKRTAVSKLNKLMATADSATINPGDPSSYHDFLKLASELCYAGEVVDNSQDSMHALPDNPDESILNSAWCLFVRRRRSNIRSRDAHAIAEALQGNKMGLSPPLRALVDNSYSSESQPAGNKATDDTSGITVPDNAFPLRASNDQARIIRKVLSKRNVVTTVQGPPGTGKTQTAVNIAGCELQNGSRILVTSVNPQSLEAFVEKLPDDIRKFCIDMAEVERPDGGMSKLCRKCDCMKFDFHDLAKKSDIYEQTVKDLQKELTDMNNELSELLKKRSEFADRSRDVISQNETKALARKMLAADQDLSAFIHAALPYQKMVHMCELYEDIIQGQRQEAEETIQVVHDRIEEVDDALITAITKKEQEASRESTIEDDANLDWLTAVGSKWDEKLKSVRIGNGKDLKSPESAEEWARVKRHLHLILLCQKFHRDHVVRIAVNSQLQAESFYIDGKMTEYKMNLRPEIAMILTAELKKVSLSNRKALKDALEGLFELRKNQEQISRLMKKIQERQTELAVNKIAEQQTKSLTQEDKSHLNQFALCAAKLKNDEASKSIKVKGKELRKHKEFVDTFHKCLGFMRLLVMTEDQVNTYIPVDKQFDLVIADEASLSNPTAVTLMPRGKQFVAIGDDKQVNPSDKEFNEDAIDVLEASLPDIQAAMQLKPGNSLFNLFCSAFPDVDLLRDHFRCPPDAIAWSNNTIYHDKMKIYKPTTDQQTALRVRVTGGKMVEKINENECRAIVDFVYKEVADAAKNEGAVNSIGIISMAGRPQQKRITDMLDDALDQIRQEYRSKTVDRHQILVGDSGAFQGNERDIMLLSCVHDAKSIKPEVDQESLRVWNVSSTRCTKKIVLFHSFDKKHLKKKNDHKRDILDCFVEFKENGNSKSEASPLLHEEQYGKDDLKLQARQKLSQRLKQLGFVVNLNRGNVWCGALSIVSGDTCDLIHIENYGESEHEWSEVVDDQLNLEGAGTSCLRVDTLSVAFMFQSTVDYIVEKLGLQPTIDAKSLPIQSTHQGNSIPVLSDPSDSEFGSQGSSVAMVSNRKRKRSVVT